jgi:hypothetical protein
MSHAHADPVLATLGYHDERRRDVAVAAFDAAMICETARVSI